MAFSENLRISGTCEKKCQYFAYVQSSFIFPCAGVHFFVDSLTTVSPSDLPLLSVYRADTSPVLLLLFSLNLNYTSPDIANSKSRTRFVLLLTIPGYPLESQGHV